MAIDRKTCRDFAQSSKLEWLETNGTGAFAMGTVAGVNTRRYHGLLVATLNPPVERYVTLARVEEEIVADGKSFALGAAQYPGTVNPRGFEYLEQFEAEPCSTWRYCTEGVAIEKQVYLVEGRQAVVIRYRADGRVTLRVRPFLAYRDYHALTTANTGLSQGAWESAGVVRVAPYQGLPPMEFRSAGDFTHDPLWYNNTEYLEEMERGLEFREDLFTPGVLVLSLEPGAWTSICASIDGTESCQPPANKRDPFLVRRADGTGTILAGYPWFTDWGRDTMISLPGLLIAPRRLNEAREILETFLTWLNNGLLPNRFPDAGHLPEYNTADATLWMFQAVRQWLEAGGERSFLRDKFYPAAREIIEWHRRGTSFNIHVDPEDRLLIAGTPGTQLTWMDAKVGDWVVTPRHGKPVEINALWHSALRLMAEWGHALGDEPHAVDYLQESHAVRASFRHAFWNESRQCLYDAIGADGPSAKIRPNQIFAVSLPHPILELAQQQSVVRVVERELLTPVGLRTLERGDPDYKPRYQGSPWERDGAYHQGTVWPWLLGPFVDAYLNAFGQTPTNLSYCRGLVERLEAEAAKGGCVTSIAEIYDGDEPRHPRGCPAQAWSVAELARVRAAYGW